MEKSGEPRVGLQNKYFNGSYHISCQELRRTFMQCQDPEDVYKLALVYFVEYVLLGRDVKLLIDVDFLNLVDYVDEFNKYPWGTLSYKKTIQSLTNCLVGRSDKFKAKQNDFEWYNLLGFPWAFQLWVYEVIPSIAASFADCVDLNLLPRMLKWSSTKAPKSKTVNDILEADEVTVFEMVNTHSESEQDYTFNCEGNVGVLLKKAKKAKQPIQNPGANSDVSSVKKSDDTFEMGLLVSSLIRGLVNHDKTIDLKTIDAKKDWFDTIIDQSKWLLDTHLDVAFEFIRKRMSENTDIFRQKCAIMDTPFHTYLNIRYKLHEENNEPSHWDRDDLLLHFVDGS
ncbi:uncharacterized protein LOC119985333 [Tripterygium wilfordii]|uniref:uncharacterized protein LOC119985333 n=1 Tax=Tripterygium wilfordii TaxID=458696 RepID=UPI0018F81E0E|nr:uncharacterized protein LOC119985333 [Tripterygium wilfordii]